MRERGPKAYEERSSLIFSPRNLARIIRNHRNGWRSGRFDFVPLYDRGGTVSLSASADGPIGTLAAIELKQRRGEEVPQELIDDLNRGGAP